MISPPRDRSGFSIAIICALEFEADAVLNVFDVVWSDKGYRYGQEPQDGNSYTTGVIADHNVVLAHMPEMGVRSAATVANNLRHSFPNIQLALIVGVCGGVPRSRHYPNEIYLGDLIVSTAVVQYDLGRQYPAAFARKDTVEDSLGRPNQRIRSLLAKLKTSYYSQKTIERLSSYMEQMRGSEKQIKYPGQERDWLYQSDYLHKHRPNRHDVACEKCSSHPDQICETATKMSCHDLGCETIYQVQRPRPSRNSRAGGLGFVHCPNVHFGKIGSGNTVLKSGEHRDHVSANDLVIAFEMEGAGAWDHFPCIIIKSVCDYADSHKNKEWQPYAAVVAAVGTKAILQEWGSESSSIGSSIGSSAVVSKGNLTSSPMDMSAYHTPQAKPTSEVLGKWIVPFSRDSSFVPRGNVMNQIQQCLAVDSYSPRAVLVGLGGVGKSQIAIEYAYQLRERNHSISVFWIHASNSTRFSASYQNIAREMKLPGHDDARLDQMDLVYQWLQSERSGKWLLIIDNVDNVTQLHSRNDLDGSNSSIIRYFPQRSEGATLLTSRDYRVAAELASTMEHIVQVSSMSKLEAYQLACNKISPARGTDHDRDLLCAALDYLPLAIIQAAAYISRSMRMTITKYIDLFKSGESESVRLLREESVNLRRDWEGSNSVIRTWEVSFLQINSQNQLAANILSLMALLDRQSVPSFLLRGDEGEVEFDEAIEILLGYAFVVMEPDGSSFSTHRLVQLAMQAWLRDNHTWQYWQKEALEVVERSYPTGGYDNWVRIKILEPHAECVTQIECPDDEAVETRAKIIHKRAWYQIDLGQWAVGESLARECLRERCRVLGREHSQTLLAMSMLGMTLKNQDKLEEAERQYRRALEVQTRTIGLDTLDTLLTMNNLAALLYTQHQYEEAENLLRKASHGYEKLLGPENLGTMLALQGFGRVLTLRGQFREAEEIIQKVLEIRERKLGKEHPETLGSVWSLAAIYKQQGHRNKSYGLYLRAMEGFSKTLGPDHPDTRTVLRDFNESFNEDSEDWEILDKPQSASKR